MSSYLELLSQNNSKTLTLNGAVTWSRTGNACLDLFAVAGGMRYRSAGDLINLFTRAYIEEPDTAMKLLFYIRDIRCGMGERKTFRTLIRYVAKTWPDSARKNVRLISEYGRFDDLLCLLETPAEKEVINVIKKQLELDLAALEERRKGNVKAHISLLAKWLPSINASSKKTCRYAQIIADKLGMNPKEYRKMLSELRANICVTERYLTKKNVEKIKYSAVPANAMLKYRGAFRRHDKKRFDGYIQKVNQKSEKIHGETLFPYEIIRPIVDGVSSSEREVLQALWNNLPKDLANENAICVVDTSGSMTWTSSPDAIQPIIVAVSLGLYHAERCKGVFHNHFITFESNPHLIKIHGRTLEDKIRYILSADWGGSTNLEATFSLLLKTALDAKATQEELPSVLYIISDMEFNYAVMDPGKTVFENAKKLFESYGYNLPTLVFINVNSWQMQVPVRANQRGTAFLSGMGTSSFKQSCDCNTAPLNHMYKILLSDRYKEVVA